MENSDSNACYVIMANKKAKNNNSSTRLPPKTKQRKQAGRPAKVNVKKLLMEENEAKEKLRETLESLCERLISILDSGEVPKEQTTEIQRQILLLHDNDNETGTSLMEQIQSFLVVLNDATTVIERSWSYSHCYPSLDVAALATAIDEIQTVLCDSVSLANKPLLRKLTNLQADPKADPDLLNSLESLSKQVNGKKTSFRSYF